MQQFFKGWIKGAKKGKQVYPKREKKSRGFTCCRDL